VACGPSAGEVEFRAEIAKTKKAVRIADIRAAVMPLYVKYNSPAAGHEMIPYEEIPKVIFSLPFFVSGEPTNYILAYACETNALMFATGSGFGHWGIIVCKDANDKSVANGYGNEVTLWGDGVYFYRGY
jgi:hypothetical protein